MKYFKAQFNKMVGENAYQQEHSFIFTANDWGEANVILRKAYPHIPFHAELESGWISGITMEVEEIAL